MSKNYYLYSYVSADSLPDLAAEAIAALAQSFDVENIKLSPWNNAQSYKDRSVILPWDEHEASARRIIEKASEFSEKFTVEMALLDKQSRAGLCNIDLYFRNDYVSRTSESLYRDVNFTMIGPTIRVKHDLVEFLSVAEALCRMPGYRFGVVSTDGAPHKGNELVVIKHRDYQLPFPEILGSMTDVAGALIAHQDFSVFACPDMKF